MDHVDHQNMRELHSFTITVEAGERRGEVIEEKHWMTRWTADLWHKAITNSPFIQKAQYDGDDLNYPNVPIGSSGNLMWHDLVYG